MKNFYNQAFFSILLIILIAFSPLLTVAQVIETQPTEEPQQIEEEVVEEVPVEEPTIIEDIKEEIQQPQIELETETDLISDLVEQIVEDIVEPLVVVEDATSTATSTTFTNEEIVPTETELESDKTFIEKVELGITYSHINNPDVQVTFTKLPENPGSLSIEEVVLTPEQVETFGSLSNIAYDITSDMENGSFEYDLKLPLPEGVEDVSKIVYAESIEDLNTTSEVVASEQVEVVEDSVVVSELDHFTVFVIVPDDIVERTLIPFNPFIQGWSTEKSGNANIGLSSAVSASIPASFGSHVIKMDRVGGPGTNRAFLGYYENGITLGDIEEIKWNVYSKVGTDTYLNVYLRGGFLNLHTASVVFAPNTNLNTWTENSLANATNITVRHQRPFQSTITTTYSSFNDLIASQYANWDLRVDTDARAGIAIISGSSGPKLQQEHYVDGITLKIAGDTQYFDFENLQPESPVVNFTTPTPAQDSYAKGTITGRVLATDNEGMGSYYIRVWKDAFEIAGGGTLVHGCQEAPGADLLGASLDKSCVYDTKTNPDGIYVFSAQFLDSDTQWGSALRTFTVDNTKPITTLNNPSPSTTIFNSNDVDFEISATDNFEIKRIVGNIYKVGQAGVFKSNQKAITGNSGDFTIDISTLTDGNYYIKYNSEDEAGNISSTGTFNFTIDNTAPEVPVHETPADNQIQNINDFYFEWTDSIDAVEYEFQSSQNPSVDSNGVLDNGVWNNKLNGSGDQLLLTDSRIHSVGANGYWYWQVRAIDGVGNKSEWTSPWKITIDMVAPTVPSIIYPTPEQVSTTTPILNEWTESTDSTTITYQIAYGYDDFHTFSGSTCSEVTEIDEKFVSGCRNTTDTSRDHTPSLEEQGGVTIWVRAFDEAGNYSDWSEGVHYYYDATPPVIEETATSTESVTEGSSGRNRTGSRITPPAALLSSGEVLGASTGICEMYITDYMKQGPDNNPEQVKKLQEFLNKQNISVPVTGYFGILTKTAVIEFQNKYAEEILKPWGVSATGFVFKTTRWKINNLMCEGAEAKPTL